MIRIHFFALVIVAGIISRGGLIIFRKRKIMDNPKAYKDLPPRDPVPSLQGIFLVLGFFTLIAVFFPEFYSQPIFQGLALGGGVIRSVAIADQIRGIKAQRRLIVQILVACGAFWIGGVGITTLDRGGQTLQIPIIIALVLTIGWFVLFTNAVNRWDGINGLASGTSAIGYATIAGLIYMVVLPHYQPTDIQTLTTLHTVGMVSVVLTICASIYTVIEFKPWGLLRDAGSMFYGFSLAYLALAGGAKIGTILVVLSLVVFDALWVFINRLRIMKKSPLQGDLTHLHHRLLALQWTRSEARAFIWIRSAVMMILMLLQGVDRLNKIIIFVMMATIFFGVNIYLFWIKKLPFEYIRKNFKK